MIALRLLLLFIRRLIVTTLVVAPIWALAYAYITYTPKQYSAGVTLILPGDGARSSVNINGVGQASSNASSPWSSSRLSPVESYRKLMMTETVHRRAAVSRGMSPDDFPKPKIKLIDQTNFISLSMRGDTPENAQKNAQAFLDSFNFELNLLRKGFTESREAPNRAVIAEYKSAVDEAQKRVLNFQMTSGLAATSQFEEAIALVERLSRRVQDVQSEIDRRSGEVQALERTLQTKPEQAAAALKLRADPIFQALLEDTTASKVAYERAKTQYGKRHPKFRKAEKSYLAVAQSMIERGAILTGRDEAGFREIADLATHGTREVMLSELVDNAAARDGLLAQITTLNTQLAAARFDVRRLAGPAGELDRLQRDHQVAEAVFASALARADTTKADHFAVYPLAQVVELPVVSDMPVTPSKKVGIIAAAAATLFMIFGLMLVWMRRSILRFIGRAFAHPVAEVADVVADEAEFETERVVVRKRRKPAPAAEPEPEYQPEKSFDPVPMRAPVRRQRVRVEPEAPDNKALDDEPLIEIPHQMSGRYTIGEVMNVRLRPNAEAG